MHPVFASWQWVCVLLAVIFETLAALNVESKKVNLHYAGLAFFFASFL